ncbi:MAG: Spy/CpxP family protein refolding chaperone [Patescibacteria group bacterium]
MKKWLRFTLVGLLIAGLVGAAAMAAGPGQAAQRQLFLHRAQILMQKLGVTPEQAAKIRAIFTGAREEQESLRKAVRVARMRLALALEEGADAGKLEGLIQGYEQAVKQSAEFRAALVRQAFAVLTAEQRAKLIVLGRGDWWKIFLLPPSRA